MTEDTWQDCPKCAGEDPKCDLCLGIGQVQDDSLFWDAVIDMVEGSSADKWARRLRPTQLRALRFTKKCMTAGAPA